MAEKMAASVCDSCITAAYDEIGTGFDYDEDEEEDDWLDPRRIAIELGADIADHRCEEIDGGRKCDCACALKAKREIRMGLSR